ncbi:MAG TPA: FAD-dependent oxidoreductase [Trebonia sp.]
MTGRRIAIIGAGVSGLTAAYVLARTDEVTIFEADGRLGGHADTHLVPVPGGSPVPVDTGFIVYNERTYPRLTRLFAELGVATQPSEMSMSVSCPGCGVGYAGKRGLAGLGAGVPRGGTRYLRMLTEVPRFHRAARQALATGDAGQQPLGDFLRDRGFSAYFTAHFAAPVVGAVWSCPPGTALRYPAGYLFAFLANHGMLSVSGSPEWRTVTGGSRSYVEAVAARLAKVRVSSPVRALRRHPDGVEVRDETGEVLDFDAAVIATHPDQALRLLEAPTPAEQAALGAFGYTPNEAVLHTDSRLLPAREAVRASWNYSLDCRGGQAGGNSAEAGRTRVSYYVNRLQGQPRGPGHPDYVVTLGGRQDIDPARIIAVMDYAHPAYTRESVAAQRSLPGLNSAVTAFAGAYHGWGFHEDGCASGVAAARALGGT